MEPSRELIYPHEEWRRLMLETLGSRLVDRPMASYSAAEMELDSLHRLAGDVAEGYRLLRLETEHLAQLDTDLVPHGLQTYADAEHLTTYGMAWGAVKGDQLACAATSYALASDCVEVAISTRPAAPWPRVGYGGGGSLLLRVLGVVDRAVMECFEPGFSEVSRTLGFCA